MTVADTEADQVETVTERWTYAGQAPGRKRAVVEVWWDEAGERLAYAVAKGSHPIPGAQYAVKVYRHEGTITRYGGVEFIGTNPDPDVRARAEAEAAAGARELARERLAEVRSTAATMTHAQREAFLAMLAREVYTARRAAR
jgi:hypothetical protein